MFFREKTIQSHSKQWIICHFIA